MHDEGGPGLQKTPMGARVVICNRDPAHQREDTGFEKKKKKKETKKKKKKLGKKFLQSIKVYQKGTH